MTQGTFGGKRARHKAGIRRASAQEIQQGRHRIGILAALGAVAVGVLVLAGAVTGSLWPEASVEAAQAEPAGGETAQSPATQKIASAAETESPAVEQPVQKAQLPANTVPANAEAASVASGKSSSLSPDERIDRAIDRITAGSTSETLRKAITVAAQEKAGELDGSQDTGTTASVPEKSAYAQASAERRDVAALSAIRNVDRTGESAAIEPAGPAEDSKPASAAAAAPTGPAGPATVSTAVRLRAGMTNNSAVVATVPAGARVQASQSCQSWCEVTYDGHRGYIYKSFIRHSAEEDAASTPAAEQAKTVAASEAEPGTGILAQTGNAKELAAAAERAQQRNR